MRKIDLTDVTFTIPVRIDTAERKRNLEIIVKYINKYFDTNILIGEESAHPECAHLRKECDYIHYQTNDPMMRRTHVLNTLAKEADTPIIVNYDTDVLFPIKQYVESVKLIRDGRADMVYPYDGRFFGVEADRDINAVMTELSLDNVRLHFMKHIRNDSVGGAIFWNKDSFIRGGMENENFVSWGFEDDERLVRFKALGFNIMRWPGILYHLNHPSSPNSASVHKFYESNQKEFLKIKNMTPEQIVEYMKEWTWLT
jgi:predicted glycosyltransferase involved in capsule biosynthesis